MGKRRNKGRKHVSDNVRTSKKGASDVKTNPFEIRINKQKHQILGRKISKHDRGLPGVSRGKAVKKRKETLLKEYQHRTKSNQFVDKRLGENDPNMTVEDKMMQRFAVERQRAHEKSVLYNLNEDETQLTHYGQSLADIEKQETILESDEDDEDGAGKFGEEDHFGGFLTKKKISSEKEQESENKSRKEMLEDIIINSKKEKYERQHEKDTLITLTEKLDKEWKDVSFLLAKGNKSNKDDTSSKKPDAYDIAVRELMYDMKASATDRLKTPEELAKEEKERLDALEADRQRRMKGDVDDEDEGKPKHISADDLYDGYDLSGPAPKAMLTYEDGKANLDLTSAGGPSAEADDDDDEDEKNEDDEEEGDGEEEDEGDSEEEEEEDNHSDLESDEDDDSDDSENEDKEESDEETKDTKKSAQVKSKKNKKNTAVIQQAAKEELPYTFKAPANYDEFQQLIDGHSPANQAVIIERVRTCHHPSLAEGNKEKLETFFSILLQYFGEVASRQPVDMELLNQLTRHLHGLCQQSPINAGQCMQSLIVDRYQLFCKAAERRAGKPDYPSLDTLLYLKLVSVLFPTSDFRHAVTTPSMLFLGQILSQCLVRSCRDVALGLFVCNLFTQYISSAKRFVPELVNFLNGLLFLASDKPHTGSTHTIQSLSDYHLVPPFRPVGKHIDLLKLQSEDANVTRQISISPINIAEILSLPAKEALEELETDEFRIWALSLTLQLLCELSTLYEQLSSFREIFHPISTCLESGRLPQDRYPDSIKTLCDTLRENLSVKDGVPCKWLQREKKRPQPIKMLEPLIEEDYDPIRKKRKGNKAQTERQRLVHRHKREMKGAIREIRKDAQFLARHKLKVQLDKDAERKQRVKEIHHLLGTQEGEMRAMERKKKKF
ncbi:nucleolar protein 14-like isoform X2 [Amphiura filiformis]|uniref:nucleolar protein 14-like isoform X2 n=1 Tax=Amphiura filiformis TaxID=82378 RepID=UPI003B2179D5